MKKILLFTLFLSPFLMNSQTLGYGDLAVLFSTESNYGTARYMGMSGAFGALGADMSAVDINPAGLAVFNKTEFVTTLGFRNTDNNSSFYGIGINSSDDSFNFTQIGMASSVKSYGSSDFKKFAFGINYTLINDFDGAFFVEGNSGIPDFVDDPWLNSDDDPGNNVYYDYVDDQYFSNYTWGSNDRLSFSFATQYKDLLYLGFSIGTYYLKYDQNTVYEEYNNDGNENLLDAYNEQYLSVNGTGVNFGFGAILKPAQNLRIGLAYQSPVWYDVSERFVEDLEIYVSNDSELYTEYYDPSYFDYKITTPGKFIGSLAYVFGDNGLISFDYTYRDYANTELKPTGEFISDNQFFNSDLSSTSSYNIGTEWRLNNFSLRGGYRFVASPYENSNSSDDLSGYSLGLGIKFSRSVKLDFAYDSSEYNYQYAVQENLDALSASINRKDYRVTSTLIVGF
ncbi:MAG: hypothetical protein ABFR05_04370 [Bacteroidota bacterium]